MSNTPAPAAQAIPEDLRRMAAQIIAMEAACIEWGATAERSRELVSEQLMILRESEQAFAAERIAALSAEVASLRARVSELEAGNA
jgi:hypothetical protein